MLPGEDYLTLLRRFHEWLKPRTYLEIGVASGRTLSLAKPPTRAIGIEPEPKLTSEFSARTTVFEMTSDAFFARDDLWRDLGNPVIDFAFVDGLHLFEQALKDFVNLERRAHGGAVILFHDCLPLDDVTSSRERRTGFWSGDVWKIVPCLKTYRPDLSVFVIPTWPTGLGVVTGLDPTSKVLPASFAQAAEQFLPLDFRYSEDERTRVLNVVDNEWRTIQERISKTTSASRTLSRRS